MPIIDQFKISQLEQNNTDAFSKCIVDLAKQVMNILDKDPTPLTNGYYPDQHTAHGIITKVNRDSREDGITGLMAGYLMQIVYGCHSRGKEFADSYNNNIGKNKCEKNDRPIEETKMLHTHHPVDILRKGGSWLGAIRSWIQSNVVNGGSLMAR